MNFMQGCNLDLNAPDGQNRQEFFFAIPEPPFFSLVLKRKRRHALEVAEATITEHHFQGSKTLKSEDPAPPLAYQKVSSPLNSEDPRP